MTSWSLIQSMADDCKAGKFALCVEMNGSITCRAFSSASGLVEEKYLWAHIGGALVNKKSGKVLEACADIGRPPNLGTASTPLRKSQWWKFESNQVLHSKNDRALFLAPVRAPDGCFPVLGCQYPFPSAVPNNRGSWRLVSVQLSNIMHVDVRPIPPSFPPPQKVQEPMVLSPSSSDAFPTSVPDNNEINMRDLLFDEDFCRKHNPEYTDVPPGILKQEWDANGIRNGRWGSPIFNVRYYLKHHQELQKVIPSDSYQAAADHFVEHCEDRVQTSELFNWQIYGRIEGLTHFTPKQLFWHFYKYGYKQHLNAAGQ